jgi:hypothetical protein
MRYFISIFLLSHFCFSQIPVSGILKNKANIEIPSATIQLMVDNKLIAYSTSDEAGFFEIAVSKNILAKYTLKITHVQYHTKIIEIANINVILLIVLDEKEVELKEIVIQSKLAVAKIKGDTLRYNLKALTTGNEEKLVDVLRKLPGIEVNEDGKIMSQGKVINDLLVNGKKMFGDNHKIATENINAEMLEGIDVLSNYENFAALKEIEGSNKTALNINIKKEFLGKITGTIDAYTAYLSRYQVNSNLFKFNEKLNVSAVVNFNNTGFQPLSLKDYFSLNKSVRQELRNSDVSINSFKANDIPTFLLSDDNVSTKANEFIAFDFAYQSTSKLSINGFSIFSRLRTTEISRTNKVFFDNSSTSNVLENIFSKNNLLYNQTKINIDYKQSTNNLVNYTLLFDPNVINASNTIGNNLNSIQNRIGESIDKINYKFGHQLSYISKIDKNKLLSFNLFQEFNKNQSDIGLDANYNLFNRNGNLTQNSVEKNNDYGFYSKLTIKNKQHLYKFSFGYIFENSNFNTSSTLGDNRINFTSNYFTSDISFQKSEGKFNYKAKSEFRHYFLKFGDEKGENSFILPSFLFKYNFNQTHHLLVNYSKTVDVYSARNLNDNSFFESFRNLFANSNINYSTPITQHIYALNYFQFDLYNGIVIMLNSSYTVFGNRLSNNSVNAVDFIQIQQINTENQFAWNNSISYEHRISKIKNKFKVSFNYINSNFVNQISFVNTTQLTELFGIKTSLISIFKNEYFNYECGLNYRYQTNSLSFQGTKNKIIQLNPFLSFNGKINSQFSYFIDNSFEKFNTDNQSTDFFNLSFKVNYKAKKFKYWFEATNVLNIENAQVIKFISSNNFTSTEIIDRLAGYIGFGIGFNIK